eukprot:gene5292-3795_t
MIVGGDLQQPFSPVKQVVARLPSQANCWHFPDTLGTPRKIDSGRVSLPSGIRHLPEIKHFFKVRRLRSKQPPASMDDENTDSNNNQPLRRKGGTMLFVGNLPFGTPWQRIKDCFRTAGSVRYTDLIADKEGRPKGSAIVTMVSAEDAENAIAKLNESEFDGRRLIVRYFHDDHSRRPRLVQRDLMPGYNESPYTKRPFGRGAKNSGGRDAAGRGRGYTAEELDPVSSDWCIVSDEWSRRRDDYSGAAWIFVDNLPLDCTVKTLELTFAQVGKPLVTQLLGTLGGRGVGRLLMASEEEAQYAITEFDGVSMADCEMSVAFETDSHWRKYSDVLRFKGK